MSNYNVKSPKIEAAPELPTEAQLPHHLETDGCKWLDDYVQFSQHWSPRSFDGYHEANGLWLLSTIAARRVLVNFGGKRYTNLYILLVGRTSLFAKTTAVKIAKELLDQVGLSHFLLPDEITPQRMLVDMSSKLPENWEDLNVAQKEDVKNLLAFAGQKGWFYDEFGSNLQLMMKRDGPYNEFRGILRKMDDAGQIYEKATISRGKETIDRPYLALIGALTPADLAPFARKGSILWGDGYLARMGLVVPPSGLYKDGRFPEGARMFPAELTEPIRAWHQRLGMPAVKIDQGKVLLNKDEPASVLDLSREVIETYYTYDTALRDCLSQMETHDFDGNYARFPEKGLRIAALFASLAGCSTIELRHWAKAQGIIERWRSNLHSLYKQVNEEEFKTQEWTDTQKVLKATREKGAPTSREIQQYTGLTKEQVGEIIEGLLASGKIIAEEAGKTTRYQLSPDRGSDPGAGPVPEEWDDQGGDQPWDQFEDQFQETPLE
jgi:hypothetical protein